jgi:Uma2 family endonuclease
VGPEGGGPLDAQQQLRAIQELLRQRRERAAGGPGEHGSGRGGEADDSERPSSTASGGEDTMPTLENPAAYGRLTPRQYLVRERAAAYKSEYNDGEIVAMSGASRRHSLIATRLLATLSAQLAGGGCEVHGSDMKVKADQGRRYMYPELSVACGGARFEGRREDVLLNPTLVVEVLSPSTERHDRGWKLDAYRRIESLREVVLLSQDAPLAEVFRRGSGGQWEALLPVRGENALLRLESIGCVVPLGQLYGGLPAVHPV